ncbi:MAG: phage holin family protein [Jiangellaceae bacterium]|nr:phage holin family protein [Jiangellaceae bacterium]
MAADVPGESIQPEASIGQLVAGIRQDLNALVRGEIELAKAELRDSAAQAGVGAGLLGAAAYLAVLASIVGSVALGYALVALGLHPAWAFLVVAVFYLLVAGVLALVGRRRLTRVRGPERAKRTAARAAQVLRPQSPT